MQNRELNSFRFQTDRGKTFFFDIKENKNGRFVKITESRPQQGDKSGYIRNSITVPEKFLEEFMGNIKRSMNYFKENKTDA